MKNKSSTFYTMAPLFLILLVDVMGVGLIFPILSPLFSSSAEGILPSITSLATRNILYGLTMASFAIFMFLGSPFLGDLSDQIGRKKVLLICLLGTSLGLFVMAWGIMIKSVLLLLFGRVIGGFCAGSQSIAQAAIADMSTPESKAHYLSLISLTASIGFVFGPIFGGYLSDPALNHWFTYTTPFIGAGILALLNSVLLMYTFRETFQRTSTTKLDLSKGISLFIAAFRHPKIKDLIIIFFLFETGWALYFQFMSLFLAQMYRAGPSYIGTFMAYIGILFALSMLLIRLVLKYTSLEKAVIASSALMLIGFILCSVFQQEWIQWFSAIPVTLGSGVAYAALLTLCSNHAGKDEQGWVMGVTSAMIAMSWFLSGLACGVLAAVNLRLPFVIVSLLLVGALITAMMHQKREMLVK